MLGNLQPDEIFEAAETSTALQAKFKNLSPREEYVLKHRYGLFGEENLSSKSMALALNLSVERIRQIELKAIYRLKGYFGLGPIVNKYGRQRSDRDVAQGCD